MVYKNCNTKIFLGFECVKPFLKKVKKKVNFDKNGLKHLTIFLLSIDISINV
jgi:hypothetical protein